MLNLSNIQKINAIGESYDTNCWGSTQYALGHVNNIFWAHREDMESFLTNHSVHVKLTEMKKGDILVLRDIFGSLIHTAVYIQGTLFWHKPGSNNAQYESFAEIIALYSKLSPGMKYAYKRYSGPIPLSELTTKYNSPIFKSLN